MKVYFENSLGEEREIGKCKDLNEGLDIITDFLKEKNYKYCYIRFWADEKGTHYDVGSHSEFFRIK